MVRIWSELGAARTREQVADISTIAWIALWGLIAQRVYLTLAAFAESGRTIRSGGATMVESGRSLGDALAGIPLVGEGLRDVARSAFARTGQPLIDFGTGVEGFMLLAAAVLTLVLLLATLVPWLSRYVPWRWSRLRRMRAGHKAIRRAPNLAPAELAGLLALRAVSRLDYATLLDFTPDPLGDWAAGRHDRLAQAELASVGLRG
jgi:hypothetical protein